MKICPKCHMEVADSANVCPNCGDSSTGANLAENLERIADYQALHESVDPMDQMVRSHAPVYIKKSQKYEDLKSSASAFILVGSITLGFSLLCWTGLINLPVDGITKILFQTVITILGAASLAISVSSYRSAKKIASQIAEEDQQTEALITWFTSAYDGEELDRQLNSEFPDISDDERNLKRLELISDLLITNKHLPCQSYVDALSEEIYSNLYV